MLKLISIAVLSAAGGLAMAQTSERWATSVCDLMSQEEMKVCSATKPGDSTGARGARCDEIAQHQIEMCLQQSQGNASAGATSGQAGAGSGRATSGENKESKISAPSPQKKE